MQNEDVANKTISIATRSASKLLRFLAKNGFKGLKKLNQIRVTKAGQGKQSYKRIYRSGQGLSSVDVSNSAEISAFKKIAKEYKMDFAVKKDKQTGMYTLFFKAKDKEIYDRVFSKYKEHLTKQKPSLVKRIQNKRQLAKQQKQQLQQTKTQSQSKGVAR